MFKRTKRRRLQKFGDDELVKKLIPDLSSGKGWLKVTLLAAALFFLAIGLSRPQIGARLKDVDRKGVEIMIALDVSNSMLAEDYTPNRLERAKLAISRLSDKLKDDRLGLVVFAGKSYVQLPITSDYVSAKMFLGSINTNSVSVQGTAMGDAINTCIKALGAENKNNKAIILITDGENHEDDPVSAAKDAKDLGITVHCIGIGSTEGKPIPVGNGELLKDKDGNIVVTKLDEETLVKVAEAGGGNYVRAGNNEFGLDAIVDKIHNMEKQQYKAIVFEDYNEQYMYFLAIALFFLIIEMLIGEKKGKKIF
jgi:Ca-activated chloride channel family protein